MTRARVITAYGRLPGTTQEIGGPVRHGESPTSAVVRHFGAAGLAVAVAGVRDVRAVITPDAHEDRVDFDVVPASGAPAPDAPDARPTAVEDGMPKGQRFAAYGF